MAKRMLNVCDGGASRVARLARGSEHEPFFHYETRQALSDLRRIRHAETAASWRSGRGVTPLRRRSCQGAAMTDSGWLLPTKRSRP